MSENVCRGRCPNPVRNLTVKRSETPFTKGVSPYLIGRTGAPVLIRVRRRGTPGVCQDWHEAVQFAVECDFVEDLAAIAFHPAIVIVEPRPSAG